MISSTLISLIISVLTAVRFFFASGIIKSVLQYLLQMEPTCNNNDLFKIGRFVASFVTS